MNEIDKKLHDNCSPPTYLYSLLIYKVVQNESDEYLFVLTIHSCIYGLLILMSVLFNILTLFSSRIGITTNQKKIIENIFQFKILVRQ